jgi:hypothetical protein
VALTENVIPVPKEEEMPVVVPSELLWLKPTLLAAPGGAYNSDRTKYAGA